MASDIPERYASVDCKTGIELVNFVDYVAVLQSNFGVFYRGTGHT